MVLLNITLALPVFLFFTADSKKPAQWKHQVMMMAIQALFEPYSNV